MKCIICRKKIDENDKSVVHSSRFEGLISLISSAEKGQDICSKEIFLSRDKILCSKLEVKFHVACRCKLLNNKTFSSGVYNFKNFSEIKVSRVLKILIHFCSDDAIV